MAFDKGDFKFFREAKSHYVVPKGIKLPSSCHNFSGEVLGF